MSNVVEVDIKAGKVTERAMTSVEVKQAEEDRAAIAAAPAVPSMGERLAAVEARLDKAASAAVTGEAAKLRDNLKPGP